jgi:hypothetical protein
MKQTQRDRAEKILEWAIFAAIVVFLVVNAKAVIRWVIVFFMNDALYVITVGMLGLLAASLEHLLRYRAWVREKYPDQKVSFVGHLGLYGRWRRLGAPEPDKDERAGSYPRFSK